MPFQVFFCYRAILESSQILLYVGQKLKMDTINQRYYDPCQKESYLHNSLVGKHFLMLKWRILTSQNEHYQKPMLLCRKQRSAGVLSVYDWLVKLSLERFSTFLIFWNPFVGFMSWYPSFCKNKQINIYLKSIK